MRNKAFLPPKGHKIFCFTPPCCPVLCKAVSPITRFFSNCRSHPLAVPGTEETWRPLRSTGLCGTIETRCRDSACTDRKGNHRSFFTLCFIIWPSLLHILFFPRAMSPFAVPAGAFRSAGASRFPDIRHRKEQTMTDAELISTAVSMQERAYVPYSHFPWALPCCAVTGRCSPDAMWRTPPTAPPSAPSARRWSRR